MTSGPPDSPDHLTKLGVTVPSLWVPTGACGCLRVPGTSKGICVDRLFPHLLLVT